MYMNENARLFYCRLSSAGKFDVTKNVGGKHRIQRKGQISYEKRIELEEKDQAKRYVIQNKPATYIDKWISEIREELDKQEEKGEYQRTKNGFGEGRHW